MVDDTGEVVGAAAGADVGDGAEDVGDAVGDPHRQRPTLSTLRNSRAASGPALLFNQAEVVAVVRGVKAGEFDTRPD